MGKYIIYLIEDCEENANKTLQKLNEIAPKYEDQQTAFEFKLLKGVIPGEHKGKQYVFYDQRILRQIEECIEGERNAGNQIGLLLDVMLTQEDIEESAKSYYTHASISREIFFRFKDNVPIYIITSTYTFASYSDITMGENLSRQFINQLRLAEDPFDSLEGDLDRLFRFYKEFGRQSDKGTEINEQKMDIVRV